MTDQEIIARARQRYCERSSDDIEIDDDPKLSRGDDGCWVQAWVWVRYPEPVDEDEDEDTDDAD